MRSENAFRKAFFPLLEEQLSSEGQQIYLPLFLQNDDSTEKFIMCVTRFGVCFGSHRKSLIFEDQAAGCLALIDNAPVSMDSVWKLFMTNKSIKYLAKNSRLITLHTAIQIWPILERVLQLKSSISLEAFNLIVSASVSIKSPYLLTLHCCKPRFACKAHCS